MSNQKIVYYNLDNIDSEDAQINLIYGERTVLMVNHIK